MSIRRYDSIGEAVGAAMKHNAERAISPACAVPAPVELRCPECSAVCERTNDRRVVRHLPPGAVPGDPWCAGSWSPGLPIVEESR